MRYPEAVTHCTQHVGTVCQLDEAHAAAPMVWRLRGAGVKACSSWERVTTEWRPAMVLVCCRIARSASQAADLTATLRAQSIEDPPTAHEAFAAAAAEAEARTASGARGNASAQGVRGRWADDADEEADMDEDDDLEDETDEDRGVVPVLAHTMNTLPR